MLYQQNGMSMSHREIQVAEELQHHAADFFARESNAQSLITVTRTVMGQGLKTAMIYFTVLPESFEKTALAFAKRSRSDFRDYVKKHSAFHPIPTIDFEIDMGEKNRQRVDDLTRT